MGLRPIDRVPGTYTLKDGERQLHGEYFGMAQHLTEMDKQLSSAHWPKMNADFYRRNEPTVQSLELTAHRMGKQLGTMSFGGFKWQVVSVVENWEPRK